MTPKESTLEKLMDAAMDCILKKGYAASSINDIVKAAGIPKGSFYYYFESKEAFVNDLLHRYGEEKKQKFEACMQQKELSPLNRLRTFLLGAAQSLEADNYECGCLFLRMGQEVAGSSPVIQQSIDTLHQRWTEMNLEVFKEAQATGEIPAKEDVAAITESYLLMWLGAIAQAKFTRSLRSFKYFHWLFFEYIGTLQHRLPDELEAYLRFEHAPADFVTPPEKQVPSLEKP